MNLRSIFQRVAVLLAFSWSSASAQLPAVDGTWISERQDAVVLMEACSNAPARRCGRITWISPTIVDGGQVLGVVVFRSLVQSPDGAWTGKVFDPETQRVYEGAFNLDRSGRLQVRSCLGPFCETEVWSRRR